MKVKRFEFRLEPVRRYRAGVEKERKREFAEAQAAYDRELAELRRLRDEEARVGEELRRELRGRCDAERVRAGEIRLDLLHLRIEKQEARVREALRHLEERRRALLEAARERKVMDRLRELRWEDHLYEMGREEQGFLDEVAGGRFILRRLAAEE